MTATETLTAAAEANAERVVTDGIGTVRTTYFWTNAEGNDVKVVVSTSKDRVSATAYVEQTTTVQRYSPILGRTQPHTYTEWVRVPASGFTA